MEDLGFNKALAEVFAIRRQRREVYGDSWQQMEDWELLAMIKQKIGRLQILTLNKKENDYENRVDCLKDLIVYSLFMLEKELGKQ